MDEPVELEELDELRTQIDDIDDQMISLLGERLELVKEIGELKRKKNLPVVDPEREDQVMQDRVLAGERHGVGEDAVRSIFDALIMESRRLQEKDES